MTRGRFITLEGAEGTGKSTQAGLLQDRLHRSGLRAIRGREPGGTAGAEALRELLLDGALEWSVRAETFLHFAARADHVDRVIQPALAAGVWVVCDRYTDSTMVYQGIGQGADIALIQALDDQIGLVPDLTIVLDADPDIARRRLVGRGRAADRYDRLGPDFMRRVRDGFRAVAQAEPQRCVLIGADEEREVVAQAIWDAVCARLRVHA